MKKWIYRHYKWKLYEVLWISIHTETEEKLVLYRWLYEDVNLHKKAWKDSFWVRPYDIFFENITIDWIEIPRFKYIWNETYKTS